MRCTNARCFFALIAPLAGAAAPAPAAVTYDDPYALAEIDAPDASFVLDGMSDVVPASKENGMTMTGDVSVTSEVEPPVRGDAEYSGDFFIGSVRRFTVGELPVRATLEASWDFKAVASVFALAGEGEVSVTTAIVLGNVLEQGLDNSPAVLIDSSAAPLPPNEPTEFEGALAPEPVLLPARGTFSLVTGFTVRMGAAAPPPEGRGETPINVTHTVEFGGVTDYAGFETTMETFQVPAPGAAAALGVVALGAVRRWRR